MSQENVEIVWRAFAYIGQYPTAATLEEAVRDGLIASDSEIDYSAMYPDGPVIRGIEAWVQYLDSIPFSRSVKVEPERFLDVDEEHVLVFVRFTAEGETSGVPVAVRNAYVFTIRDGVVVRWQVYGDRAEALKAAGLSE
jgi:ketosteroid isomerase-like protein